MTSDLPAHREFAGMACVTIAAALVGDLFFLPAMLACFPGRSDDDPVQTNVMVSGTEVVNTAD
jgi:hypothetical protein